MGILEKLKLGLALKRVSDAIDKENKVGHDWSKTGKAVAADLAITSVAVLAAYFSEPEHLAALLGVVPESLRLALIPLVSAGLVALRKRIKHGGPPSADLKAGALTGAVVLR